MDHTDSTSAPDAPPARRVLRRVSTVLVWALTAVAAILLWPTSLGGCTTLTIVSGHSMEPTFHTGDLVASRCGEPTVGDIVVYQPHELGGARIIHRVIGGDPSGWQIQGDNNDWVDPFSPTDDEILGVARLHVPQVGLVVQAVTSPWIWASLIVLALAILVWPRDEDEDEDGDDADDEADDRSDDESALASSPVAELDPAGIS